jgi:hypothetical protein
MEVSNRYRGLRIIGLIAIVLGWIVLIVGLIVALVFLTRPAGSAGVWLNGSNLTGMLILPLVLLTVVQLFVTGSVLKLLVELEHNTRVNTQTLEGITRLVDAKVKAATESSGTVNTSPTTTTPPAPAA